MFVTHSSRILMKSMETPMWKLIAPFNVVFKRHVVNNAQGNTVKVD